MMLNTVHFGDCRDSLRAMAAAGVKVQMCVTSPPYFGLRDYGHDGQIGLEPTPDEYIAGLVEVFRAVRDVLADDGTLWLNIGDSYAAPRGGTHMPAQTVSGGVGGKGDDRAFNGMGGEKRGAAHRNASAIGLKHKDLIGIPWMLAFALRADGWYLRQDIIWHKPNPMPESVTDRCTKAHEYVFLLSKSAKYFYDNEAIKDPVKQDWGTRNRKEGKYHNEGTGLQPHSGLEKSYTKANKRSVWSITTRPYKGAHFAVFPPALVEPCILAGTSERGHCPTCGKRWARQVERTAMVIAKTERNEERGTRTGTSGTMVSPATSVTTGWAATCDCGADPVSDVVLDPFMGSGTTAAVAIQHGRQFVGCELNPAYKPLQDERIEAAYAETLKDLL